MFINFLIGYQASLPADQPAHSLRILQIKTKLAVYIKTRFDSLNLDSGLLE
ncbi:MAG: hypothetical protein ACI901_001610, partial [Octadecabacter sp.]